MHTLKPTARLPLKISRAPHGFHSSEPTIDFLGALLASVLLKPCGFSMPKIRMIEKQNNPRTNLECKTQWAHYFQDASNRKNNYYTHFGKCR